MEGARPIGVAGGATGGEGFGCEAAAGLAGNGDVNERVLSVVVNMWGVSAVAVMGAVKFERGGLAMRLLAAAGGGAIIGASERGIS